MEEVFTTRRRSSSFLVDNEDDDQGHDPQSGNIESFDYDGDSQEQQEPMRGRSRSRSFLVDDDDDNQGQQSSGAPPSAGSTDDDDDQLSCRRRSRSMMSDTDADGETDNGGDEGGISSAAAIAAMLTSQCMVEDPSGPTIMGNKDWQPPQLAMPRGRVDSMGVKEVRKKNIDRKMLAINPKTANQEELTSEQLEEMKEAELEAEKRKRNEHLALQAALKRDQLDTVSPPPPPANKTSTWYTSDYLKKETSSKKVEKVMASGSWKKSKRAVTKPKMKMIRKMSGSLGSGEGASVDSVVPSSKTAHKMKVKILLLGDSAVGKTSLMDRFVGDKFNTKLIQTVGVDFKIKNVVIDGTEVVLQIWDTAGQQRFHQITKSYYRNTHAIILVYDVTRPESFENISYWAQNIQENAHEHVVNILVGNKTDLAHQVSREQALNLAQLYGVNFFETSAKDGAGVEEAFKSIGTDAYRHQLLMKNSQNGVISAAPSTGKVDKNKNCVIS